MHHHHRDNFLIFLYFSTTKFWSCTLHKAPTLESVHLLISMETGGGGCLYALSDCSVIKAEPKDVQPWQSWPPCLDGSYLRKRCSPARSNRDFCVREWEIWTQHLQVFNTAAWGIQVLRHKQYSKQSSKKWVWNNDLMPSQSLLLLSKTHFKVYKTICFREAGGRGELNQQPKEHSLSHCECVCVCFSTIASDSLSSPKSVWREVKVWQDAE